MPVQTLPFQSLILIDRSTTSPVYQQVANGLIKLILEGKIKPGHSLLPSRTMAGVLNLNRTTVVAAYEELKAQDWVRVVPRKGILVSAQLPVIKPRAFKKEIRSFERQLPQPDFYHKLTDVLCPDPDERPYDIVINDGYPDTRIAPMSALFSKYRSLLTKNLMDSLLLKGAAAGSPGLRNELGLFLAKTRGISAGQEQVMITRGAQAAIYMAARIIIKPGSTVIVGDINYNLANDVFTQAGASLIKVKVDENGLDIDEVEQICKKKKPDLLYIIPHHHHPTTVTLSAERRMKLLKLIRLYRLPVIEDDYDYDFHYDNCPILPLASADHDGYVIYIGSITKTLAPSIKMGYIVANADLIWQIVQLKRIMEIRGDVLMEEAVASLFSSGEMQRHITRSVKLYKNRRDFFCELMSTELKDMVHFCKPSGGMAIWTTFKAPYQLSEIAAKLGAHGIYLNDGSHYGSGLKPGNSLRIGFASMNEKEMCTFVKELKNLK